MARRRRCRGTRPCRCGRPGCVVARVVHEADVLVDAAARRMLGELLRGHRVVAVEVLVLVVPLPLERLVGGVPRWMLRIRCITSSAALLGVAQLLGRGAVGSLLRAGRAPSARMSWLIERLSMRGLATTSCVSGIADLRHQSVLAHQGDEHVPLAAVLGGVGEQVRDGAVVDVAVGGLDDRLEPEVGLLELVPVEQVVLRELEVLDAHLLGGADAEQVEAGEQPAATALLLVGHLPVVEHRGHRGGHRVDDGSVQRDVVEAGGGDSVLRQPVGRVGARTAW